MIQVKNKACIRRLSFKALWASRKRNFIAILAIALTTLLFTSLFTVVMSLNDSYQTYSFRQIGGYCHGTFKDVTEEQVQALSNHSRVKETGARTVIGIIANDMFSKVSAEVSWMDDNCAKWSYCTPTTGRLPQTGKEIAMDTDALKMLGIEPKLGAKVPITFQISDKDQTGFEHTETFTLVGWWDYDKLIPVHYINISKDYVHSIEKLAAKAGLEPFRTDLNVMLASSINIRGVMEQIDTDLGYQWENIGADNCVRIGVNWGYTSSELASNLDPKVIIAIIAFVLLVIFTGYLIIYNIFQISVTGDIQFYGLLKTIGTTPRQLRTIIRNQALLLCVIGIPLGLAGGYGIGAALTPYVLSHTSLEDVNSTISISPWIFIGSALFSLITVLLSCTRPGRMAAKVSPVEATKYTEVIHIHKKRRNSRSASIYQMAKANLGRNRLKTGLVVISLALSVVLLNILFSFVNGFDIEKYLAAQICSDFVVGSTEYFQSQGGSEDAALDSSIIETIRSNTDASQEGIVYATTGSDSKYWMPEDDYRQAMSNFASDEELDSVVQSALHRGDTVAGDLMMEGLDSSLFDKLTIIDGDLSPLFDANKKAIAIAVDVDDYGNVIDNHYPVIGDTLTVTFVKEGYYIDSRTGKKCDDTTPEEYIQYHIESSYDIQYTVCAYVIVPYAMSFRYSTPTGCTAVLPIDKLRTDSISELKPMVYLFDTSNSSAETQAERYLSDLTKDDLSPIMYESKAIVRKDFEDFQQMFLLLGGLLCFVIGLVGILNFFNGIMTGILSRRKEFAVLQSVGMTRKQLNRMLIYEGLFYTAGAVLLSLLLSLVLCPLIGNLLENMFWFYTYHLSLLPFVIVTPIFILMGVAIPMILYRATGKISIVERLRETE